MTWLAYTLILVPLGLEYLYTLSFILIIAALVQFVEEEEGSVRTLQVTGHLPAADYHLIKMCFGVAVINMERKVFADRITVMLSALPQAFFGDCADGRYPRRIEISRRHA